LSSRAVRALLFLTNYQIVFSDGALHTAQGPYHNLLMLPLDNGGPVVRELQLVSGAVVRVTGEAIKVRLFGEPEFIEDVT
jgi:hypothetical protein